MLQNSDTKTILKPSQERAWMKYYPPERAELPDCSVYTYLKERGLGGNGGRAINYYGKSYSYGELFEEADRCADAFAALGVKPGEVVSFISVAIPETIFSIYGLNKIGAIVNLIDPRMDAESITRMIRESGSRYTICIDIAYPKAAKIKDEIAQDKIVVHSAARSLPVIKRIAMNLTNKTSIAYNEEVISWDAFLQLGNGYTAEHFTGTGEEVAAITYTGGTTGFPKGVLFTNNGINAVAYNFRYAGLAAEPGQSFLGIIPVFTSYGLVCGLHMPLCMGVELMPIPKFEGLKFGALVKKMRPNHFISTPAFIEMLMDSKEVKNLDMSFLITMGSGGDTMNKGLEERLSRFMKEHNIKYPLAQGYGLSELSAAVSFCVNDIYKPGSVGIPSVTTVVGIFDPETGEELGYNQKGEVCVTGPAMMKGYYNRPEETAHVMRRHDDGRVWIHTGDVGYIDEDGFLFIQGRIKRMICRFDGHKVFPVNIESMVVKRDNVHNCCVIGVNDRERQGQYPLVLVMLHEGVDQKAECASIYAECMERLEERGRPVAVLAVDKLPLTGMGKNDYRTLEQQYADFDYTSWTA